MTAVPVADEECSAVVPERSASAAPVAAASTLDPVDRHASIAQALAQRIRSHGSIVGKRVSLAAAASTRRVTAFFSPAADEDFGFAEGESEWSAVLRFLWWYSKPMLLPLFVFCIWVCINSWQFTGEGCYYNTEMIVTVLRTEHAEKWSVCGSVQTKKSCQEAEGSGCSWSERGGFCDIDELAELKQFEFLMPRLSHYAVSDGLCRALISYATMTWATHQVLLSLWGVRSHFAFTALVLATELVRAIIVYRHAHYGADTLLRTVAPLLWTTLGIVVLRPRRVPFELMAKAVLFSTSFVVWSFGGAVFFQRVLRPVQVRMRETDAGELQRGVVELLLVTFFLSVYTPLGAQQVGKYVSRMALVAVEFNQGTLSPADKFEVEKYMRTLINRSIDIFRYAYGRGVLLKVSPVTLTIIVMKDVAYDVLHFGVGFHPYWRCFLMKLDQSRGVKASEVELPLLFRLFARVIRLNSIINRNELVIGISFQYEFDCKRTQQVSHTSTNINFSCCSSTERPSTSTSKRSTRGAKIAPGPDRRELQSDMQAVLPQKGDKGSDTYTRSFRFANHRITARNIPKLRPLGGAGANAQIVEADDIEQARQLLEFLQDEIFARFLTRMQIRLYVAAAFLVSPALALAVGDAAFFPGFPRSDASVRKTDERTNSVNSSYNAALSLFLLTDAISFFSIFFCVHLNKRLCLQSRSVMVGRLKAIIVKGGLHRFFWFNFAFLLLFPFMVTRMAWNPYDLASVRTQTGVHEVTLDHIRAACIAQLGPDGDPMKK